MVNKIKTTKKSTSKSAISKFKKVKNQTVDIPVKKEEIIQKENLVLENQQNDFSEIKQDEIKKSFETFNEEPIKNSFKNQNNQEDLDIQENKYVAAFSYLSFLFIIPLFLKRQSAFCQKHAKQGLVWFAVNLIACVLFFVPVLKFIYGLIVLIVTLNAIVQTLSGKYWRIPFIYKWAEKINL